jgi:cytidylate kinase
MGYHQAMQKYIDGQVRYWKERKAAIETVESKEKAEKRNKPFITLSREYGVGAYELGEKVVQLINEKYKTTPEWAAYDRALLDKIIDDLGLSESLAQTLTDNARNNLTDFLQTSFSDFPPQVAVFRKLVETIRTLAIAGNVVIVGRAGNIITRDMIKGFHVRIVAPLSYRAERISKLQNVSHKEAEHLIAEKDGKRDGFIKEFVKFDNADPLNYHISVNLGHMSVDEAAAVIVESMKACGYL